ncbi:MAG: Fumarate reductase flavoprotein subunit [Syntrophus sp. SKADARSKE-3]|nr:Fumarate reductase flavoprotein subunit [Syntrophus sp. SKADARSKE-3]
MEKERFDSVNRRQFIRGIGLGAGLLALGKIDIAEAALLPKAKRSEKFGVIVIGTGLSGMSAAVAAQIAGAKVAVLEKLPERDVGGNSKLAGGLIAVPRANTQEAKDEYFEDFMKKSSGKGNAVLTKVLANQAFEAVEWLAAQGAELTAPMNVAGYRVKSVVFKPGAYKGMPKGLAALRMNLTQKGGKIIYDTKAKQLIMDDSGAVVGVRAQDAQGLKDYMADAVVIASGGYGANREMLETFVDPDADEMMVRGVKTATGDGLNMAREAGAMWVNMGGMASVHVAAVSPKNQSAGNPFMAIAYTLGINKNGKRYVDESLGYVANGKASMKQPGQTVAMIFDEEIKKQPGVTAAVKQFEGLGISIVEAESIGQLAAKIGVPAVALEKTIADFNATVKDGKALDAQPAKTAFAYKVESPKFYAFYPLSPGITLTFGGIKINEKAQVQEADGSVIPGLFAAGECAGGLYYEDYIGGASLANCLVMGRIAGQQAAAAKAPIKKVKGKKG